MNQQPTFPNPRNSGISDDIELIDLVSDEDTDIYSSCTSISTALSSAPSSPRQLRVTVEEKKKIEEDMEKLRATVAELTERDKEKTDIINRLTNRVLQLEQQPGTSGSARDRGNLVEPAVKKVKMDELTAQENNQGCGKKSPAATTTGPKLDCIACYLKFENDFMRDAHTKSAHGYKLLENGRLLCRYKDCLEAFSDEVDLNDHMYENHYDNTNGRLEEYEADIEMNELTSQENNRSSGNISPVEQVKTRPKLSVICPDWRCDLRFENLLMQQEHIEVAHGYKTLVNGRIKCSIMECGEIFNHIGQFRRHEEANQ
ncbi:unnamed protein product [Orchesella dallaii]|uniref:C2H2-type domain-containing protein n=1 Tax=Orchesella dallaii TaxID=48710 RepID=A0ABP1QIK3_9HEXA